MALHFLKRIIPHLLILLLSVILFSCSSTQKIKYFQDIPDSGALNKIANIEYQEPKIQIDDILTVLIETVDPSATMVINTGNVSTVNTGTMVGVPNPLSQQSSTSGYLVDKEGYIELPVLKRIKVAGLTTAQAKELIRAAAVKFYNDPTVIVRYANFKISITGEVAKPGTYIIPNEKVSILDALALAGDLTIYGKRENVLLLRENPDGSKMPYRINLKKSDIMSQPSYYLRQNDLIYVQPSNSKAAATDAAQARNYTLIGSVLTVLIVLFSRIN